MFDLVVVDQLSSEQLIEVGQLQSRAFDVDDNEADEDFYHTESAHVLAYMEKTLVGWAGIHLVSQLYQGKEVLLGGYGICTHPDWRRQGIARKVSKKALGYLAEHGCDVAFLSVNVDDLGSMKLHQENGFVRLKQDFSWKNSKGEIKIDSGAMIAAITSEELFAHVLNGAEVLHVGNGYW